MDALRGTGPAPAGSEKRRSARMDIHTTIVVTPLQGATPGKPFTALTRDVSAVGIGLLQATSCALNEQLIVHLPRGRKPPLVVLCNVMHVRMLADGLYLIGAEFIAEGAPAAKALPPQAQKKPTETPEHEMERIRSSILS